LAKYKHVIALVGVLSL